VSAVSMALEWPSMSCTVLRSVSADSSSYAAPCLRPCSGIRGRPASVPSALNIRVSRSGASGSPLTPVNPRSRWGSPGLPPLGLLRAAMAAQRSDGGAVHGDDPPAVPGLGRATVRWPSYSCSCPQTATLGRRCGEAG
jgi:hypothetical protein